MAKNKVGKVKAIGKIKPVEAKKSTVTEEKTVKAAKPSKKVAEASEVKAAKPSRKDKVAVTSKEDKVAKAPKPVKAKEVKSNPLQAKLSSMLESVKVCADKVKFSDDAITVTIGSSLSAKQFSKLKSLSGKKAELSPRGESWIITYR